MHLITTILLLITGIQLLMAQATPQPVLLQHTSVTPGPHSDITTHQMPWQKSTVPVYGWLQFSDIPDAEDQQLLQDAGVSLLGYLPGLTYLAAIAPATSVQSITAAGGRYFIQPDASLKIHAALLDLYTAPPHMITTNGDWEINIIPFDTLYARQMTVLALETAGISIKEQPFSNRITAVIPPVALTTIAALPWVYLIEPGDYPAEPDNYTARTLTRSNAIATDYGAGRKYTGTGVTVGLQDDGLISNHIDYQGRVTQNANGNGGNHGDHIAGTIMGAGNLEPVARGMAYGARLYVRWVYDIINNMQNHYNNDSVYITSTSYSNGCNTGYTSFTQTHDQQILNLPQLMHVFSAGNAGNSDCGYGAGTGWGNITGGHKMGKNVLAVGNLTLNDDLAGSSSRGPATDGRIKPDICAKGTSVYSTVADPPFYASYTGTSMACPNISGIFAQLYDAYRQTHNNVWPGSALIKTIMLNTAEDLGNPGPDYKFGWGRVNALHAAEVIENNQFLQATLQQSQTRQHTINVPQGVQQLRIMVYWHDVTATPGAAKHLVNDIDMVVTTPGGSQVLPWTLDPTPDPTILNAPAVRGVDTLNNMEQVTIDLPAGGNYTVTLSGTTIPFGPQPYTLTYYFVQDGITVTYPIGGESLVPGQTELIRWDAHDDSGTFSIDFSADSGQSWQSVASGISGNLRQHSWAVPNQVTGKALIRINRNGMQAVSDAPFSIIGVPTNFDILWACGDSLKLRWDAVPGAVEYEVSRLGSKYMDSIGRTSDLHLTVDGILTTWTYWFSVRAIGEQEASGRRARAISKTPGDINCVPFDAALITLISPLQTPFPDCIAGSEEQVTITLLNSGVQGLSQIPVYYRFNNGAVVADTIPGPVYSAYTLDFTFAQPITLPSAGTYTLDVWVDYPGDGNTTNDTLSGTVTIYSANQATLPYTQDFDDFTNCSTAWGCAEITCALSEDWYNAANSVEDDIDFRTNSGGTGSGGTGPSADHTSGSGKYLYLEGSGNGGSGCQNNEARLYSPCFSLANTNEPRIDFWAHAYGGAIGSLHLDVYDGQQWQEDVIPPIVGEQGNFWLEQMADLTPYEGKDVVFRFRGLTGSGWLSDLAIDDISVTTLPTSGFIASDTIICPGATVSLVNQSFYADSYQWIITPAATAVFVNGTTPQSPQPQVQFTDTGYYDIMLITANGRGTDTLLQPAYIFAGPFDLQLSSSDDDNLICTGTSVVFTATSLAPQYSFYLNSTLVQSGPSSVYTLPMLNSDRWVIAEGTMPQGCPTLRDSILIRVSQLSAQTSTTPTTCFGGNNGTAAVLPANGFTPYTYQWSSGDTTATAINLTAGTYQVTVQDVTGCQSVRSAKINQPTAIQSGITAQQPICAGTATASAAITVSGGTPGYQVSWSNGQNGQSLTAVTAGTYYVTVVDQNQCLRTDSILIMDVPPITIQVVQTIDAACFGQASGAATVTSQNGTRPFSWQWSTGDTDSVAQQLAAGNYQVTLTDGNGCISVDTVAIGQPASTITTQLTTVHPPCFGEAAGVATIAASGGVGNFTFAWSDGQTGSQALQLTAGLYQVTTTDQNGCGQLDSFEITQPAPIAMSVDLSVSPACNGFSDGSITLAASGGTGALQYQWNNGMAGNSISQLVAGIYQATVTDGNGCADSITINLSEPDPLSLSWQSTDTLVCPGKATGSLAVFASGGTPQYAFIWNTGDTTATVDQLAAGTYLITVSDAQNCTTSDSLQIAEYVVAAMSTTPVTDTSVCPGFSLYIEATPGFASYTWNTGDTTIGITQPTGQYVVIGIDTNGCASTSDTLFVDQWPAPAADSILGDKVVSEKTSNSYRAAGLPGSSYQWGADQGNILSGQGTDSVVVEWNMPGSYTLWTVETTGQECVGDTLFLTVVVESTVSVPQADTHGWSLYPNPANQWVQVTGLSGTETILLYNPTGQLVKTWQSSAEGQLQIGDLPQGAYLMVITDEGKRAGFTLVKW